MKNTWLNLAKNEVKKLPGSQDIGTVCFDLTYFKNKLFNSFNFKIVDEIEDFWLPVRPTK